MWTPEYFIRLVPFPPTVEGATMPNDDGTFDIYLNSSLSASRRETVLRHEIRHLMDDHFYRGDVPIAQIEASARSGVPLMALPKNLAAPLRRKKCIKCFVSLEDLRQYALTRGGI